MAARKKADLAWQARGDLKLLNHELPRIDGPVKVSGRARYTHDIRLPGMLWGRVLCAPSPCGKVTLDLSAAKKIDGVADAISLFQGGKLDGRIGWLGQPLAAVAARTPELADDGIRAIGLKYEREAWAVDHAQATAENAPKARKDGNVSKESTFGDEGEASSALAAADARVEASYSVPVQHHASLETHGVVVDYRGDEATVYASTQGTFTIPADAADELKLETSRVTAIVEHMGGGFGSKFGIGPEGRAACLLSKELKRPVHLLFTRADEFVAAGNRSGNRQTLKGGASQDGRLVALVGDVTKLGGIGGGSFPGRGPYIYEVEKSFLRVRSVFTHTDSSRAMRAPGHPQASFGMESLVDELAYAIAMDPLEFRKKNLKSPNYARHLDAVAKAIGWADHPNRTKPGAADGSLRTGIGFAVSTWGGGTRESECVVDVKIERDGSVTASVGSQDLGTGVRTYVAAIVAEELGLELAQVLPRIGDSRLPMATASGGSTTTASLAPSVKDAAWNAREAFAEKVAKTLGVPAERVRFADGRVADAQDPQKGLSWKQACATLPPDGLTARGKWRSELASNGIQGAQAAKVEVDTLTGRVRVLAMACMQNCGLPLNRLALRSQIQGGMVQALSYALLEERVIDRDLGLMLNANFEDYKLAAAQEMPEMTVIFDDEDARGVIGVAEATIIPGHGAIANAVFNACGARVRDLPLTPDKVLAALGKVG